MRERTSVLYLSSPGRVGEVTGVGLSCGRTVCVVGELGLSNGWGIGIGGRVKG